MLKLLLFCLTLAPIAIAQNQFPAPSGGGVGTPGAAGPPSSLVNNTIIYVTTTGSDSASGLDWTDAKATIGGALAALPVNGTLGSGGFHYGTIHLAPGLYVSGSSSYEWNAQKHIDCVGTGTDALTSGCIIQSPSGSTVDMFSSTSDFEPAGFSHFLQMSGITLDANGSAINLVRQAGGGVNNVYRNMEFKNATGGRGIWIERTAINVVCEHCAFFDNTALGGAAYFHDVAGLNMTNFTDIQVDRCGSDPFFIEQLSNSMADTFNFSTIKFESSTNAGSMAHIIHLKPRTSAYGNPANININGAWSVSTAPGGGFSFAYEENQPGIGGRWHLSSVVASSYAYAWQSDKQKRTSSSNVVADSVFQDTSANVAYAYVNPFTWDYPSSAAVRHNFTAAGTFNLVHGLNTLNPLQSCTANSGSSAYSLATVDANTTAVTVSAASDLTCSFVYVPVATYQADVQKWLLNEGAGTAFVDSSNHPNTLTGTGITFAPEIGVPSVMAQFSGTSFMNAANQTYTNFTGTTPFSVSAWVYFNSVAATSEVIAGTLDSTNNYLGWDLEFQGSNSTLAGFLINSYPSNAIEYHVSWAPLANTLYHVVMTYDGSRTATGVSIYVNGSLVTTNSTATQNSLSASIANTKAVRLGSRLDGTFGFVGGMADVELYSVALTPNQVSALYSAGAK